MIAAEEELCKSTSGKEVFGLLYRNIQILLTALAGRFFLFWGPFHRPGLDAGSFGPAFPQSLQLGDFLWLLGGEAIQLGPVGLEGIQLPLARMP